jgi:inosine-uridine nucleoside N-ribohydrolase
MTWYSPRKRVIVDNDFAGDPDGLYQLVHHALSPSVEIPVVIASHLGPDDFFDPSDMQADHGAAIAERTLGVAGRSDIPVVAGSNVALRNARTPIESDGARAIIREAMRTDTDLPLVVALGGSLTELASAYLLEPRIAERLGAIWIGGFGYETLALELPAESFEYNVSLDVAAAQVVFDSAIPLWQVPMPAYRQCSVSKAEIDLRVRPHGELGKLLAESLDATPVWVSKLGMNWGETYILGDSPLVLLSALLTPYGTDAGFPGMDVTPTSGFDVRIAPGIRSDGRYVERTDQRSIRVYRSLDTRLMFEDFYAKLALQAR